MSDEDESRKLCGKFAGSRQEINDEVLSALITAEGLPIRIQSGDRPPVVAGWLDWHELREVGPARVMAAFLRQAAQEFDRIAERQTRQ